MSNERLRSAILEAGLSWAEFGEAVGVDPKTVERWITKDRVPHRAHRVKSSVVLGKADVFLWPTTESDPRSHAAAKAEFVDLYPSRGSVPSSTWVELLDSAQESIDLLGYAGSFLHDSVPSFAERLSKRAAQGVAVRLLFGDPASDAVALRGREEGIGELMAARCALTWTYFAPLLNGGAAVVGPGTSAASASAGGVEARQHGCTLYASLFRFDDTLLVNPHAYGAAAGHSPVLHLNHIPGGRLFTHYLESFDRTWEQAKPAGSA